MAIVFSSVKHVFIFYSYGSSSLIKCSCFVQLLMSVELSAVREHGDDLDDKERPNFHPHLHLSPSRSRRALNLFRVCIT